MNYKQFLHDPVYALALVLVTFFAFLVLVAGDLAAGDSVATSLGASSAFLPFLVFLGVSSVGAGASIALAGSSTVFSAVSASAPSTALGASCTGTSSTLFSWGRSIS